MSVDADLLCACRPAGMLHLQSMAMDTATAHRLLPHLQLLLLYLVSPCNCSQQTAICSVSSLLECSLLVNRNKALKRCVFRAGAASPYSSPVKPYSSYSPAAPAYSPKASPSPSPIPTPSSPPPTLFGSSPSPVPYSPSPIATPKPYSPAPTPKPTVAASPIPLPTGSPYVAPKPYSPAPYSYGYASPQPYGASPYAAPKPSTPASPTPTLFGSAPSPSPAVYSRGQYSR